MSRHDDSVSLRHMLDHAREAVAMARGRSRIDLESDRGFQLAVTRLVEIVGEAATRVSPLGRSEHPEIPWANVIGTRNRLIHGYDRLDLRVLWDTLAIDLPPLITFARGDCDGSMIRLRVRNAGIAYVWRQSDLANRCPGLQEQLVSHDPYSFSGAATGIRLN